MQHDAPKEEIALFEAAPPSQGPDIPCEVCEAPAGLPCKHGIRTYRSSYRVPPVLRMHPLVLTEKAECWLLFRGDLFVGRLERHIKPLPRRLPWSFYDASGQFLQGAIHPRSIQYPTKEPSNG